MKNLVGFSVFLIFGLFLTSLLMAYPPYTTQPPEDGAVVHRIDATNLDQVQLFMVDPSLIQREFVSFRPRGYSQNVVIPPDHVILPTAQFVTLLNNTREGFDINTIKPIGALGEMAAAFQAHGGVFQEGGVLSRRFEIKGTMFTVPTFQNGAIELGQ